VACQGPGMRRNGATYPRPAGAARTLIGAVAALAISACAAHRAGGQMSGETWSTDPTMSALNPGEAARFRSGPDFPTPVYSAIGSALALTGHFAEIGWNEAQVAAFLDGMRSAFQGRPVALDDRARQLLSDVGRLAGPASMPQAPGQGPRVAAGPDFPLASCSAIGSFLAMTGHLAELGWNEAQVVAYLDGMRAALLGKPFPFDEQARLLLSDIGRQIGDIEDLRKMETLNASDEAGRLAWYLRKARNRLGLQQSDSGLAYRVERGRGGVRPRPGDTIVFTCAAFTADGTTKLPQMSGERIRMKMDKLLPGLMEGLQMMSIDATAVFILPPKLSFGDNPWPDGVQRGSPIIFSVALHDVTAAEAPP